MKVKNKEREGVKEGKGRELRRGKAVRKQVTWWLQSNHAFTVDHGLLNVKFWKQHQEYDCSTNLLPCTKISSTQMAGKIESEQLK